MPYPKADMVPRLAIDGAIMLQIQRHDMRIEFSITSKSIAPEERNSHLVLNYVNGIIIERLP